MTELYYLLILNAQDSPVLFKNYKNNPDDLSIQLHCYASLDFLDQKLAQKCQQYLGKIYTIYNNQGQFSVYAFTTITKIKILMIFKEEDPNMQVSDQQVANFAVNIYKLYKKQVFQAFSQFEATGRFTNKFYKQLDSYVIQTKFKINTSIK